jgi:hypothetical protein
MSKITVVNPHHWLNEDGSFPEESRVRSRMIRVAQCIEYGGTLCIGVLSLTLIHRGFLDRNRGEVAVVSRDTGGAIG